jgi:hypothetical protein
MIRFLGAFRGIADLKGALDGFITASAAKANPARSADQPIVAEVCRTRLRITAGSVCPCMRAHARRLFLKTKREKFVNELKRFGRYASRTDTHLLQMRVYFCQRNFLPTLSHFCKKSGDSAYSLS